MIVSSMVMEEAGTYLYSASTSCHPLQVMALQRGAANEKRLSFRLDTHSKIEDSRR